MSNHTDIRLETTGGTVVAYLAPNFEVTPVVDNDLKGGPKGRGDPQIVRDFQFITHEVTAQGVFESSANLPDAHATDLENLFGTSPVTARDQVNRVVHYMTDANEGGPFYFYDEGDQYTAETEGAVDPQNGVYPAVAIEQFRPPAAQPGVARHEYTIKMQVGLES